MPAATRASGFVEICVESLAGARAAIAGGADQIELCSALALGGLTPSAGLVECVLDATRGTGVTVRAMVRARPGGFVLDADDLAVAVAEARQLAALGVDGLVFGATRGDGIDHDALRHWRDALGERRPALTFHRAIDTLSDPVSAVAPLVDLGFDQILTSGGATSAMAGAATIAAMHRAAAGRCRIVAGAGVRADTATALVAAAGTRALHGSARAPAAATTVPPADPFGFGFAPQPADIAVVRALRAAVDNAIL